MPALFLFLFKVNVALILFCLGYYLVLRHLTFYTLNRVYLVTAILFSTMYPNINLSGFAERHQQLAKPVQTVIIYWKIPAEKLVQSNYWQWAGVIFWTGVILFAAKLIMQLFSLYKLYRQSRPGNVGNHYVRLISDEISPFSFWRNIYINPSKLSPSELKSVLEHEQVHVNEWHTLDILLAELSTIFYWFNPGVWLMKKAVRENIEFITDRKILQKGMDSKEYQYSLVSVGLATPSNSIVNHFNMSTIKKRIIMMNTKKSSGYKITRYIFLVPAVVALLLTFSLSKAEVAKHTIKSIAKAISHVAIVDNSENPIKKSATPTALVKAPLKNAGTNKDTIYSAKAKNGKKSFMVTANTGPDSVNFILNGQKSSKEEVYALDPERLKSVVLLSAQAAKEFYPALDNDRQVMFVTTEDSEKGKELKAKIDKSFGRGKLARIKYLDNDSNSDIAPSPSTGTTLAYSISSDDKSPVNADETNNNINKNINTVTVVGVDPKVNGQVKTINRISVDAKPAVAVSVRGMDSDEAPEAYTISPSKTSTSKVKTIYVTGRNNSNNDQLTIDGKAKPLYLIDGKEAKSFKNLSPEDIKSITVLKDGTAQKKYGEKGKNGVIEITTKKEKEQ